MAPKDGELAVEERNAEIMDNEKAGFADQDTVALAGVGKRQQLGVSRFMKAKII